MTDPTDELDLLYSDVEDDLRGSLRDLLAARCLPGAVIALGDGDRSLVGPLWQSIAVDLGLAGLLVPEEHGGVGASAREAAVVLEELGRAVAPVPFLTSAVVATTVLAGSGDELVAALAEAERTAAVAVPFATGPTSFGATVSTDGGALTGTVTSVAGALEADVLLVPVRTDAGVEVHEVTHASVTPVSSLDMTRQLADVTLDRVTSRVVVPASEGDVAVRTALQLGAALLASEQLGLAQWCLDTTVAHLKERRQFGRQVGGFQALKHRLADLYVLVESARAAARNAAATVAAEDPDAGLAASVAQSYCSDVAVRAAEECIQLHGGIGMTWDHPAHLYLKRAKADQLGFGAPDQHRAAIAALMDLPAAGSPA